MMSDSTNTDVTYEFKVYTGVGSSKKPRENWRPFSDESEAELTALISDGWELVSTHAGQLGGWMLGGGQLVLRRPAT